MLRGNCNLHGNSEIKCNRIMTAIRTVVTIGVVVVAAALLALLKVIVKVTVIMVIAIKIKTME